MTKGEKISYTRYLRYGKKFCVLNYCKCDCGGFTENDYINGHNGRKPKKIYPPKLCDCDCGGYTVNGNRFINGHNCRVREGNADPVKKWVEQNGAWNKDLKGDDYKEHFPNGFKGTFPSGSEHPNYIDGSSRNSEDHLRTTPEYKQFRLDVYKRDDFSCQMCDSKDYLNCHHIFPYTGFISLRLKRWNGITLCTSCHRKTYNKEEEFVFQFLDYTIGA